MIGILDLKCFQLLTNSFFDFFTLFSTIEWVSQCVMFFFSFLPV